MKPIFVLATVVVGLALAVLAGMAESRLLIRGLIVGVVPVTWAVAHAIERLTGRDMWHYTAPNPPDQWTRDSEEAAAA